jgi:hypothetical protein
MKDKERAGDNDDFTSLALPLLDQHKDDGEYRTVNWKGKHNISKDR